MSNYSKEREELHKTIWNVANVLRGSVDGWSFKAYVLGTIFYRYLSENIAQYINELQQMVTGSEFDYTKMPDDIAIRAKNQIVEEKGYFLLPSQLFCSVYEASFNNDNLNETLNDVFRAIESSAMGTPSEVNVRGLFSDYMVNSQQLGSDVRARNELLRRVLDAVAHMNLGHKFSETECDTFGDAYEYLMQMYASNAGKSGGEFFTPQEVSELLVRLCQWGNPKIKKVYDPACGSGSLLLKFARMEGKENKGLHYYGQEINPTTYNLCRSNMFLHDINYDHFHIALGDTLMSPKWQRDAPFDAIVSNPPYSLHWDGEDNPLLINDERFAPAGVLAPKTAADLAFTMHMLYNLSEEGTAAIVEFPGILYRGRAEEQIREYLVGNNYVDTIIQLPANLFFGVGIVTCIIVLKKNKKNNNILFIDATEMCEKVGNKNKLRKEHQDKIVELYQKREEVQYYTKLVSNEEVLKNECNLSVSSYVEQRDTREKVDIKAVNAEISQLKEAMNALQEEVDAIVTELGEEEL